jgi:hypothetical protein
MDPNPFISQGEYLKLLEETTKPQAWQKAYLNEWGPPPYRPSYRSARTLRGMQESWITSALENRGSNRLRYYESTDLVRNPDGVHTPRPECGRDMTPLSVFMAWQCALSGLVEGTRIPNTSSFSRTLRSDRTPFRLGYECETCTFPTAPHCIARTLFNMHASRVFASGTISIYVVMDVTIAGPLISVSQANRSVLNASV